MKYLTRERKKSSVDKWLCFINDCTKKVKKRYFTLYWNECGFCYATKEKGVVNCDLFKNKICFILRREEDIVYSAILNAQNGLFDIAVKKGKKVLRAIRATEVDKTGRIK